MRRNRWRRSALRLLRRYPLRVATALMLALAGSAITITSAAGLLLVQPQARVYPVSLLSVLEAQYGPWPDSSLRRGEIDPAIIAEAARDEQFRNVPLPAGGGEMVPLDLAPLPQALGSDGRPVAQLASTPTAPPASMTASPTTAETDTPAARTPTRRPSATASATSLPSATALPARPTAGVPVATVVPVATIVPVVPLPTSLPTPTPPIPTLEPTVEPSPTAEPLPPTNTPVPPSATVTPVPTRRPTTRPSNTPVPPPPATATNTAVPGPSATPGLPLPTRSFPTPVTPGPTTPPVLPSNTPVPPTNTPVPPTNTPVPPTDTPVPPTDTPVPPTDTPVPPTDTPVPPTNTPVPGGLVVQFSVPGSGTTISDIGQTAFEVTAYDPAVGTGNGAGVIAVEIQIVRPNGSLMTLPRGTTQSETALPYCAFGDNGNACNPMDATNYASLTPGTYTIRARAQASSNGIWSAWVSRTFTV